MSETLQGPCPVIARRVQRGQTLIVAIAVLFVLLFVGGVFVAQVARNLIEAGRSRETQSAQALADAGIKYCQQQLESSIDGADWRPAPTAPMTLTTVDPNGVTDPDYYWLNQGYARISLPGGRALVRVVYDPHPDDPRGQLLRIEAVGRTGDLGDGSDPTVFVQSGPAPRLRRELIAYMQIGLTDYLRFITNKDNRDTPNFLGTPAFGPNVATVFGDPSIADISSGVAATANGGDVLYGGNIRANGSLTFGGDVRLFLNQAARPFEGVQVSGRIFLDNQNQNPATTVYVNTPIDTDIVNNPPGAANRVLASTDPAFSTLGGLVRSGSTQPDATGNLNGIPYLNPPLINSLTDGGTVMRYRALTRLSGTWTGSLAAQINTGQFGLGTGIYINNPADRQVETTSRGLNGSYSMRADWTNPNAQFAQSYWQGPFYRPPGVLIELLGDHIRLTRSDNDVFRKPDGTPITQLGGKILDIPLGDKARASFKFPDGTAYALPPLPHYGDDQPSRAGAGITSPFGDANSYGVNLVIMAEGNVRVKGVYGVTTRPNATDPLARVHLTIVSGGTAYIEGNVVKGDGYLDNTQTQHQERASTCAIMALDYVCVNTTAFMAANNQSGVFSRTTPDIDGFDAEIGLARQSVDLSMSFGVNPRTYPTTNNPNSNVYLMLRHAAQRPGPAYINLLINPATPLTGTTSTPNYYPFFQPNYNLLGLGPEQYILGKKITATGLQDDDASIAYRFTGIALQLDAASTTPYALYPDGNTHGLGANAGTIGTTNIFRFQTDPSAASNPNLINSGGASDYLLGGAMVAPLDIRIEAALYAQENSFFVIPGYPFNPDAQDNRQAFVNALDSNGVGFRSSYSRYAGNGAYLDKSNEALAKDLFPFYGDPVDVRITVFGAVAENYTASSGDQARWMERWGFIPESYGSTGPTSLSHYLDNTNDKVFVPDDHLKVHDPDGYIPGEERTKDFRTVAEKSAGITRGLRFIYDPAFAMPYVHPTNANLRGEPTDTNAAGGTNQDFRARNALRYIFVNRRATNSTLQNVTQVLPPIPRLPVCPGLLYYGDTERTTGL